MVKKLWGHQIYRFCLYFLYTENPNFLWTGVIYTVENVSVYQMICLSCCNKRKTVQPLEFLLQQQVAAFRTAILITAELFMSYRSLVDPCALVCRQLLTNITAGFWEVRKRTAALRSNLKQKFLRQKALVWWRCGVCPSWTLRSTASIPGTVTKAEAFVSDGVSDTQYLSLNKWAMSE